MFYFIKSPWWLKRLYRGCIWQMPDKEKLIYLSFDDGPHETITRFVLDELKKYNARATFFCIGKNVLKTPEVYKQILAEGHTVGNHTFNHLNGWKTKDATYLHDIAEAKKYINTNLFRPPYGKITRFQLGILAKPKYQFKIIMWDVLSGDFDNEISPQQCLENVLLNAKSGSIIVFHDSEKANDKMRYALPLILKYFTEKGYRFEKIAETQ